MPLPLIAALIIGWSALVGGLTTAFVTKENNAYVAAISSISQEGTSSIPTEEAVDIPLPDFVIQAKESRQRLERGVAVAEATSTTDVAVGTKTVINTTVATIGDIVVTKPGTKQPSTISSLAKKVLAIDTTDLPQDKPAVAGTKYSLIVMPDTLGTVISSPTGIRCGFLCVYAYTKGTVITLTATPNTSSTKFTGWTGACSGTGSCTLTMNQIATVGATYTDTTEPVIPKPVLPVDGAITSKDVATHASESDCWIIVSGKVYSVGSYIALHPGGRSTIVNQCGKDATDAFGNRGGTGSHSGSAWSLLATFLVGAISTTEPVVAPTSFVLSAAVSGTGSGSVIGSPTGINCSTTCSATYAKGATVTLTAIPTSGSTFSGWTGPCTGSGLTCSVTMNQTSNVTANFAMTVNQAAQANGYTAADVATHSSASDCWIIVSGKVYSVGSYMALHPGGRTVIQNVCGQDATTVFNNRGGTGSHSGSAISLLGTFLIGSLAVDTTVPVVPPVTPSSYTLSTSLGGTGLGTISSSPSGISCGTICSSSFAKATVVTLTAIPSSGSTFSGWSGACTGTATCKVTMNQASSVVASFALISPATQTTGYTAADVATHTSATDCWIIVSGKIYSVGSYMAMHPGGRTVIQNVCGQDATTVFNNRGGTGSHSGSAISLLNTFLISTLTATTPTTPGTTPTTPTSYALTLAVSGAGTGLISSSPSGISCGSACTASYTTGTTITLTASPFSNSVFGGWTGACTGKSTCSVTMNQASSVGASFTAVSTTPVQTTFTTSEVANHATASDCWFHISGKVYSVGSYIAMHPGGSAAILNQCGQDATTSFGNRGGTGAHSSSAWALLNSFLVGTISANTGTTPTVPPVVTTPTVAGYTVADVATHNTSANCWIIVSGSVYSVGSYVAMHPGGRTTITNQCGKDATTPFSTRGGGSKHSTSAWNLLNTFLIGKVTAVTTPATGGTTTTTPTTSTTTTTTPTTPTTPTTTYTAVKGTVPSSILQLYPSATIKKQDIGSSGSQELEVNTTSGCRHIKVNSSGVITSNSKC